MENISPTNAMHLGQMRPFQIERDEVMSMTAEERDAMLKELETELRPGDPNKLNEMARFYLELAAKVENQKALLAAAETDLLEAERSLIQIMKEGQINKFTFNETNFKASREKKISVLAENRGLQHDWLRETGHGDLIVPREPAVNDKTFGAFIKKEVLERGIPLPDFIKVYEYDKLTVKPGKK